MNTTILAVIGIAAGVINIVGLVPYVRDVFRHRTKPERATWWVWLALGGLAFYAQVQAGVTWALVLMATNVLACGLIATLSIWFGYGRFRPKDIVSLVIAALGIVVAQFVDSPLLALLVIISVDIVGYWLTLRKSWIAPYTETLISWAISSIAGAMSVVAVGELDLAKLIYPLYLSTSGLLLVVVITTRRKVVAS